MELRDELAGVPWAELEHAYGPAQDTPRALLDLLSPDGEVYRRALSSLWASICHQGSVYEASCAAVPFLIEIVRQVPIERKPTILYLLAGLAHRDWYANQDKRFLMVDHEMILEHPRAPLGHKWWSIGAFVREGNQFHEPQWMERAHQLVGEGIPDYLSLLDADEASIVMAALYVLSGFRERSESIVPGVQALLSRAHDPFAQASALLGLGALLPADSPLWEQFRSYAEDTGMAHPLTRFAAALGLAWYQPGTITRYAVECMIEAMVSPQRLDELFHVLHWGDDHVHLEACDALSQLGAPRGLDGLVTALERGADHWRIVDTVRVAEAVLDVAFFGARVHDRYWSITTSDRSKFSIERVARMLHEGDNSPYEERYYYNYGTSYDGSGELKITCNGYGEREADELKERFAREGSEGLSSAERRALEAVLRCESLWQVPHDLLRIYGLPTSRDELEQFLAG
jgi:hypothetical protein